MAAGVAVEVGASLLLHPLIVSDERCYLVHDTSPDTRDRSEFEAIMSATLMPPPIQHPPTSQTAWESVPGFIRFMTWVVAIMLFVSTIASVITFIIMLFTGLLFAAAL